MQQLRNVLRIIHTFSTLVLSDNLKETTDNARYELCMDTQNAFARRDHQFLPTGHGNYGDGPLCACASQGTRVLQSIHRCLLVHLNITREISREIDHMGFQSNLDRTKRCVLIPSGYGRNGRRQATYFSPTSPLQKRRGFETRKGLPQFMLYHQPTSRCNSLVRSDVNSSSGVRV